MEFDDRKSHTFFPIEVRETDPVPAARKAIEFINTRYNSSFKLLDGLEVVLDLPEDRGNIGFLSTLAQGKLRKKMLQQEELTQIEAL